MPRLASPAAPLNLWAAPPEGLAAVTAAELDTIAERLGVAPPRAAVDLADGGLRFAWPADQLAALCQWLRTAETLLVDVGRVAIERPADVAALVNGLASLGWLGARGVEVRVHARQGAADRAKWLLTQATTALGERRQRGEGPPTVLHLRVGRGDVAVAIDAVGGALHRRGYRLEPGAAPLRETLAAALLLWAGWQPGCPVWDPCCGSGTLLIEAALLGQPLRDLPLACRDWPALPPQRPAPHGDAPSPGQGGDLDPGAVAIARRNAQRAGIGASLQLQERELGQWREPAPRCDAASGAVGLVAGNLPWGVRLGQRATARRTAERWAAVVRRRVPGWRVALAVPEPQWGELLGLQDLTTLHTRHGGRGIWLVRGRVALRP